ncbi:MAG: PilZ domain-containing protein [Planctomycetota bacterium]|jgi:hypothetical protein
MQTTPESQFVEKRGAPRYDLPAPYTAVRVKREGRQRYSQTGHAYDISASGLRMELDVSLEAGETIEVTVELPGYLRRKVVAIGRVIRLADDEIYGPVRMGVAFQQILEPTDLSDFENYVHGETIETTQAA